MGNCIILPIDDIKGVRNYLNYEQIGKVLLALIAFTDGEDPGEMEPAVGIAFSFVKTHTQLKPTIQKPVEEHIGINTVLQADVPPAVPASSDSSRSQKGTSCTPSKPSESQNSAANANELFEKLWKLYPNKKGKGRVSAAKRRAFFKIGEDQMTRAIQRYIQEHDTKQRNGEFVPYWQNGSTFFNSGYVDYLDENYVAAPKEPAHSSPNSSFYSCEQSDTDWNDVFYKAMLLQEEHASLNQSSSHAIDCKH